MNLLVKDTNVMSDTELGITVPVVTQSHCPLELDDDEKKCRMFVFFVAILNLHVPRAFLLVPDFYMYFLHIIQYGDQYGDRRTKRKQSLLGF